MKKKILLVAFILGTFQGFAQTNNKETSDLFALNLKSTEVGNMETYRKSLADDDDGSASSSHFLIGFRFMPTITNFDLDEVDDHTVETSFLMTYGYGGFIGFTVSDHVGFQGEIIYTTLAQKYRDANGENRVKVNYINVPLLLVLNTNYNAPVNFNVAVGPQFGFNTGSKIETADAGNGADSVNAILSVKAADVGFAYGAGLDFGFGERLSTRLSIGFRGVYGLVDISDKSQNVTTNDYYVLDRAHVKTYSGYIGLTFVF